MTPEKTQPSIQNLPRNVWALGLTSFFTDISSEMVFNLLPLFLYNVLGVRTSLIGLIEGIAETTASLLKIFSGYISDRLGKRKWLTATGYTLSAVTKPLLYFASTWGWVLGVRFTDRVGKGIRTAPRDALIADSIDDRTRGLAFGVHRAADTAGAMLGLIIAAGVVWAVQAGVQTLEKSTFQTVVLVSILPGVLGVLSVALGARDSDGGPRPAQVPKLSLKGFDVRFKAFLLIVVLFTLGNSSDAFLILRAQERGLTVLQVMGMLITFNLIYAVIATPAGALSDRIGRRTLVLGGWLVYGLIYLGFALSRTGGQVWVLYALYGVYYGMVEGTAKAFVADLVPKEQRGTAYGVYNAAVGLTAFPASFMAGLLWQGAGRWAGFGAAAPFYFGAGMALFAVGLFGFWLPRLARN
ncbi:MAG: MFS transporter [Anaerolineales bacterium]|nr:MFS transporter [Anaerolineales bacterium]